ncbi:MAG: vitamin K epoxide reductase family protein [FCB group bacterium]|nr:vitamin K epoxide reductase family protein [FCB group bacterium]
MVQKKQEKKPDYFGYRPVIDRIIFILALIGVLTTVHLWIQHSRGFDRGCLGISIDHQIEDSFDCESVLMSAAGKIFGIPNTVAGHLYYLALVMISLLLVFLKGDQFKLLRLLRFFYILGGLGYTSYLVYYQYFVLDEFCALCLISASVVTLLFLTQIIDRIIKPEKTLDLSAGNQPRKELILLGSLIALTIVLSAADVIYFNNMKIMHATEEPEIVKQVHDTKPPDSDPLKPSDSNEGAKPVQHECYYHPELIPVDDWQLLISKTDPYRGNPLSKVVLIEYFDPNCRHCKTLHGTMKEVIEKYGSDVQFVYKPYPLWNYSVPQVEALYIAAKENKFFEMLDRQFELQNPGKGLTIEELRTVAEEIGMNGERFEQDLTDKKYRKFVMDQRSRARDLGIKGAPVVMINGQFISSASRTVECLGYFLDIEL